MRRKEKFAWKILGSKIVLDNKWLRVRRDKMKLPNGAVVNDYFVTELPNIATIFAVTKNNEVLFIKEYRHAVRKVLLGLPAGTYNKKLENPKKAAARELLEETGYKAGKFIHLGTFYVYATKIETQIDAYLTQDVEYVGTTFKEATENIELIKIPLYKVSKLAEKNTIQSAGVIATILRATQYLKRQK